MQTDQDIEWKFMRSKLYMEYMRDGSALPVPFNVIPTPSAIAQLVLGCLASLRRWRLSWFSRRRQRRLRDVSAGESGHSGPGGGQAGDGLDIDESSPIYNGVCPSPNTMPMSKV
jgi:hypothetical protein